jgi:hypothetical protein
VGQIKSACRMKQNVESRKIKSMCCCSCVISFNSLILNVLNYKLDSGEGFDL